MLSVGSYITDQVWRIAPHPIELEFIPTVLVTEFPLLSPMFKEEHEYLAGRGISQGTYEHFGVRVNPSEPELVFSFTNILGNVIGIVFRKIYEKKIVGLKVEGVELPKKAKAGAWFGLHLIDVSKPVLVVEGELDCMCACEHGFHNVISPGGMSLIKPQAKAIPNKEILVGFDADAAGEHGWRKAQNLWKDRKLTKINWSPFKDPGEIRIKEKFWERIDNARLV